MSDPERNALPERASTDDRGDVTILLRAVASGDRSQMDRLMEAIYDDLRRLAVSRLKEERRNHTFQPTALVHEAYLRLVNQERPEWNDRVHFFAFASTVIRRILIDHARAHRAKKRGSGLNVSLESDPGGGADAMDGIDSGVDLLDLHEALEKLEEIDERQARVVELRFFGGCTLEEIADLLDVGRRTVDRDWVAAKAWLYCELVGET